MSSLSSLFYQFFCIAIIAPQWYYYGITVYSQLYYYDTTVYTVYIIQLSYYYDTTVQCTVLYSLYIIQLSYYYDTTIQCTVLYAYNCTTVGIHSSRVLKHCWINNTNFFFLVNDLK